MVSKVKKSNAVILIISIFFSLFQLFPSNVEAKVPVVTIEDGKMSFEVISTAATASIKYYTVGWTIRKNDICTYDSRGKHCDPTGPGSVQFTGTDVVQTGQDPDPPIPGRPVTTYYDIPEDLVTNKLFKNGFGDVKDGQTIYLYAIMRSINGDGSKRKGDFSTLDEIKDAEAWAHKDDLDDYYAIPVVYHSKKYPAIARFKDDHGNVIKAEEKIGEYKAGEAVPDYSFEPNKTIKYNGKTYKIYKSYISPAKNLSEQKFVQNLDNGDTKVLVRSFTNDLGGSVVYGIYREENPVKAKFLKQDGTTLKPDVEIGDKPAGTAVSYTFPEPIVQGGKGYTIVKSYITDNSNPTVQKNVQVTGQPALKTRNFTVADGGSNVVGVYKEAADCSSNPNAPECKDPGNGGGNPTDPGGGGGTCTPVIGPPSKGTISQNSVMDPSANGVVKADNRDSEKFDVLKGIPTSESLYVNVLGKNYLFQNKFANMTGKVTYTVPVKKTFVLKWTIPGEPGVPPSKGNPGRPAKPAQDMSDTVTESRTITVERPYSYWQIDNLEAYKVSKTTVNNYALPSGAVTINPSGYTAPSLTSSNSDNVNDHVQASTCQPLDLGTEVRSGGSTRPSVPDVTSEFTSKAESSIGQNKVRNDHVVFNGSTIMDNGWTSQTAPKPGSIPLATTIGRDVLYGKNYMISKTLLNKANTPSTGSIYYDLIPGNIKGGSNKTFPVNGLNTVTVHTPTVNYSEASDDKAHNQRTTPDNTRRAFILDRPFTVTIPTSGQHRNITGYGNRDYAKYIKLKQVRFEFDVYSGDKAKFYPANTWIDVPVPQLETKFYLPKWIDEGNYTVYYRSFAENSPSSGFTTEQDANLNLENYVATDTIPVQVIGRIYDFRVTDIADPNWETVFRTSKGSSTPKGTSYWVGPNGIDGEPNGSTFPYVLPILRGSHPLANYKSVAVKTGYHFKFDLKTKGNMYAEKDAIRITPSFYFQDSDASTPENRVPVDLYYHSDKKKFIKIGSAADTERREIKLNNRLRNVPYTDIVNTAGSIYDLNSGWSVTRDQYINSYVKRSGEPTYVGGYNVQILPSPLRTYINSFDRPSNANASPARVNASVQQWYGEYSLPAAVYVVPKGTDLAAYGRKNKLDDKSPIFLKNGFITVNFNIESIRNADLSHPYLQYIHSPLNNQWWDMEGFDGTDGNRDHLVTDPYGVKFKIEDGDVIFYDAKRSSYDDYTQNGTH